MELVQVSDGGSGGGGGQERAGAGLPGAYSAAHSRQRMRAHHGSVRGRQGQDGPGHWRRPWLLHPGTHRMILQGVTIL